MSALQGQVDGDHYKTMAIQPFQFSMANDYDPCAHTILKYISRHNSSKGKGLIDIQKAAHTIALREQLVRQHSKPTTAVLDRISMADYCQANGLGPDESGALHWLDLWCHNPGDATSLASLKGWLDKIARSYQPG